MLGGRSCIVIDTGGLQPDSDDGIYVEMARQTEQAIVEADAVVLVTDARAGLTPVQAPDAVKRTSVPGRSCPRSGRSASATTAMTG